MRRKRKKHSIKQVELPLEETKLLFETKGVFSDHYIKTKLRVSSQWPKENEVRPLYEFCLNLWNRLHITLARSNEELTRQEFLEKVLPELGFAHIRNQPLPAAYGRKEPDYLLFSSLEIKESAVPLSKQERYALAISVMEAKKVNHPLGAVSKTETPGRFPHQQIRDYLQEATDMQGKSYFNWAILTSGNLWRLYCRNARPNDYFEFDFEKSLNSLEDFMIFAALFRAESFVKNGEGRCLLDDLRDEALQFQTKLEDDLRKRVFNILENLANGFYKYAENKIAKDDLNELYESCLVFLYRLLFILYAEGRGLLPVKPYGAGSNKNYRKRHSLQRLIPRLRSYQEFTSEELTDLYEELVRLFHLINGDRPSVNRACSVPLYNGRLFDSRKYPEIDRWRIGEKTLADVLGGLIFSTIPERAGEQKSLNTGETIDYADLEVRQLGSIYEGLLENHLKFKNNRLRLVGDKAERKATGTYYTPDYIVQYIVKNTLGPLCDEIERATEIQQATAENKRDNSFAKAVLKLNILDPAMGSGHFLVRATEFLADKILNHPTTALNIEKVSPGLSHEQTEIAYWRRWVVESCIYGVDLNPLAVELAKLSLWLTCISSDQPLNFLDHHLRIGNSLIGAKLAELSVLPSKSRIPSKNKKDQLTLSFGPDLPTAIREAIRGIHNIEETESKDIPTVKDKESKWYNVVLPQLEPYRTIADLWTCNVFGSAINKAEYPHIARLLVEKPAPKTREAKKLKEYLQKYRDGIETTKAKKVFHWELQFPEVFFNEDGSPKENPGFDAIIGNPPYGYLSKDDEKDYFRCSGQYSSGELDAYILFYVQSIEISRTSGRIGFITPDSWLTLLSAKALRKRLYINTKIQEVVDMYKPFPDSKDTRTHIFLYEKNIDKEDYDFVVKMVRPTRELEDLKNNFFHKKSSFNSAYLEKNIHIGWNVYQTEFEFNVHNKMDSAGERLGNLAIVKYGLRTGNNKKYITKSGTESVRAKIVAGADIERYVLKWTPKYLTTEEDLPSSYFEDAELNVDKIVIQYVRTNSTQPDARWLECTYVEAGFIGLNSLSFIYSASTDKYSIKFLLALLNSKLMNKYYRLSYTDVNVKPAYLSNLPIPTVLFITPIAKRIMQLNKAKELYRQLSLSSKELISVIRFVDERMNAKPQESDVVHDFLAFLVEQMVTMNEEKQKASARFLSWLEKEIIRDSIKTLKAKSKIKKFYESNLDAIIGVLKQNRILQKTIGFGDDRYENLEKAFNDTMAKLNPLIDRIFKTDNLIDQIVYKLYGLTDEETRFVEESYDGK